MNTNNKCYAGRHTQKKWHLNECYQISMLHDMHILIVKNSKKLIFHRNKRIYAVVIYFPYLIFHSALSHLNSCQFKPGASDLFT